jgi:hypothetical protein
MDLLTHVEDLVRQKLEDKTMTAHQSQWAYMVLSNDQTRQEPYLLAMLKNTLEANQ